ncbi:MAG: outer membrane protein TolC [Planctomycetota bacterium]|jgi:outer membrane protein TolC
MIVIQAKLRRDSLVRTVTIVGVLSAIVAMGCSAAKHSRGADRSATRILDGRTADTLGDRRETVQWPDEAQPEEAAELADDSDTESEPKPALSISLGDALELAFRSNRDYLREQENLFVTALLLAGDRHTFSPQLSAALDFLYTDTEGQSTSNSTNFSAGLSQRLRSGGTISLDGQSAFSTDLGTGTSSGNGFDSNLNVRLLQPLLRGAGYEASHAVLIQSERSMIYAVRDFELFREDFSIDVARRYYDLAQQYQSIENERRNLEDLTFGEEQATALNAVGRVKELDVLRARRNRLNAEDRLLEARESYELATERFRIFLGLPEDRAIDIIKGAPDFVSVNYDVGSAIDVALHNRLDFINRREQLEDVEREVRLSKNGLLPELSFEASANIPTGPDSTFLDQRSTGNSATLGVSLALPVDRVSERIRYRRAQIGLAQAKRAFEQFRDELVVEIESSFRELERRTLSLDIQRQLIEDEQKNVRVAQLRFERGELPNRDVVEAQQSLLDARNSLIREQVNYEIARLTLLRDLGIVFIDERGMWTE